MALAATIHHFGIAAQAGMVKQCKWMARVSISLWTFYHGFFSSLIGQVELKPGLKGAVDCQVG